MRLPNSILTTFYITIVFLILTNTVSAQILTIDKLERQDTTKQQNFFINTDFGFNYIQEEVGILDLKTSAELTYFMKKDLIYSVTQYNLASTDNAKYLNAGYTHLRYRINNEARISPEFFGQYQWDGVRGMKNRALGGSNLRFTLINDSSFTFYAALGVMYEYEVWDYRGVAEDIVPLNSSDKYTSYIKLNSYFKINKQFSKNTKLIFITYIQARPDNNIIYPRISPSLKLNVSISKKLSFVVNFSSIYDFKPIVPIRNFYYSFSNTIQIRF